MNNVDYFLQETNILCFGISYCPYWLLVLLVCDVSAIVVSRTLLLRSI